MLGTLVFDRCPPGCRYLRHILDANFDKEEEDGEYEVGDRICMVNIDLGNDRKEVSSDPTRPDFVSEFPDVFSAKEFDQLPAH